MASLGVKSNLKELRSYKAVLEIWINKWGLYGGQIYISSHSVVRVLGFKLPSEAQTSITSLASE